MALSSTIFKVELQVSDLDRHYYQTHNLTVALHPSETELRMMVRILVFALNASESLEFTRGISSDEVPDLWEKNLTGDVILWIELGQPTAKRLKKACGKSEQLKLYTFSGHGAEIWWQQNQAACQQLKKLQVINLPSEHIKALGDCVSRNMALQCTIQDGMIWLGDTQTSCEIIPQSWQG